MKMIKFWLCFDKKKLLPYNRRIYFSHMRSFLRWQEFRKSCKCGSKSNFQAIPRPLVQSGITYQELSPHRAASQIRALQLRSRIAWLQRPHCVDSWTENNADLKPHCVALKPHSVTSMPHSAAFRCGLNSWHVTPGWLLFIITSKSHCSASRTQNSNDLKPHSAALEPHCTALRTRNNGNLMPHYAVRTWNFVC